MTDQQMIKDAKDKIRASLPNIEDTWKAYALFEVAMELADKDPDLNEFLYEAFIEVYSNKNMFASMPGKSH